MHAERVAILGCARDCARFLPRALSNVEHVATMFADHRVYVFENDSSDATQGVLQRFSRRDPARRTVISQRFLTAKIPGRTRRLAYARQRLHRALSLSGYKPDVVVVMDLDDVGAGDARRLRAFVSSACAFRGWHAAFPRLTYDLVAWHPWPATVPRGRGFNDMQTSKEHEIRVSSSFNGVGVYLGAVYAQGRYLSPGEAITGRHVAAAPCEHIVFHASLGPSARLVVLPGHTWPS